MAKIKYLRPKPSPDLLEKELKFLRAKIVEITGIPNDLLHGKSSSGHETFLSHLRYQNSARGQKIRKKMGCYFGNHEFVLDTESPKTIMICLNCPATKIIER